jgi:hypothetical protein
MSQEFGRASGGTHGHVSESFVSETQVHRYAGLLIGGLSCDSL